MLTAGSRRSSGRVLNNVFRYNGRLTTGTGVRRLRQSLVGEPENNKVTRQAPGMSTVAALTTSLSERANGHRNATEIQIRLSAQHSPRSIFRSSVSHVTVHDVMDQQRQVAQLLLR